MTSLGASFVKPSHMRTVRRGHTFFFPFLIKGENDKDLPLSLTPLKGLGKWAGEERRARSPEVLQDLYILNSD